METAPVTAGRLGRRLGVSGHSRGRVAEQVSAASYGNVLVLAALSVIGISEVAEGHGVELMAGVGGATWVAHLFAELLGGHVHDPEPLRRSEVTRAMVDGSPILIAPILPACALLLGRLDVVGEATARTAAILVAMAQLLVVAAFVAKASAAPPTTAWMFSVVTVVLGVFVVAITVVLGH